MSKRAKKTSSPDTPVEQSSGAIMNLVEVDGSFRLMLPDDYFSTQKFSREAAPAMTDQTRPIIPVYVDGGIIWAWWGDSDDLPQRLRQKIEAVPLAGRCLQLNIELLVGEDLAYFKEDDAAGGPIFKQEIEDFLFENRIREEWLPNQARDFSLLMNCFSEIILSKDKTRVTNLYHIEAESARLTKQNPNNRRIEFLLYSHLFALRQMPSKEQRFDIPLYQWSRPDFWNWLQGKTMAWHTQFSNGGIYYGRPFWLGLFQDGSWLDVAASVPRVVAAMQRNQIALKYVVYFPESYFELRYPDWQGMNADQRKGIYEKVQKEYNDHLSGSENALKTLMTIFKDDLGTETGKVQIVAVDDKTKQGTWVPDAGEANQMIAIALGIDPSLLGLSSHSNSMGAGSGSNTREGFNTAIQTNTVWQKKLLEPLNFISKHNGWGVKFYIQHEPHAALNQSKTGKLDAPQPGKTTEPA